MSCAKEAKPTMASDNFKTKAKMGIPTKRWTSATPWQGWIKNDRSATTSASMMITRHRLVRSSLLWQREMIAKRSRRLQETKKQQSRKKAKSANGFWNGLVRSLFWRYMSCIRIIWRSSSSKGKRRIKEHQGQQLLRMRRMLRMNQTWLWTPSTRRLLTS